MLLGFKRINNIYFYFAKEYKLKRLSYWNKWKFNYMEEIPDSIIIN